MLDYLRPNCTFTLREAIAQLREEDAKDRDVASTFAPEIQRSMMAHDAVHVIFGCDTSDRGEALAHAWMLLGTTVTMKELRAVTGGNDHRHFATAMGHFRRLRTLLSAMPAIASAALRARRMKRRLPWTDYDRYLDRPLCDIREELGIGFRYRKQA